MITIPINASFKVTQFRKPWNQAAAWVLLQAEFLAAYSYEQHLYTVEEFAQRLRADLKFSAERNAIIRRGMANVEIKTWTILNGETVCGIDKPNSTNGAAFTISLEKEVTNA